MGMETHLGAKLRRKQITGSLAEKKEGEAKYFFSHLAVFIT